MGQEFIQLLKQAVHRGASDIHILAGTPPILRVNGALIPFGDNILEKADTENYARRIIPKNVWIDFEERGEIDFSYELENTARFRVNATQQRAGVALAIRIVPTEIPTIEQLQLPSILADITKHQHGLVLVTGPTGSGKSTTLASMIDYINQTMRKHIITLEDPIEYVHKHQNSIINQREIGYDTKSFASGLKSALRQDPDVILVGELRDLETIQTAITAAETGHLVMGTLHTSGAVSAINRIVGVFPSDQQNQIILQLSSVLKGVISQLLLPTIDHGRIVACEILLNNHAVSNLIRGQKFHQIPNVIQTSKSEGMQLFEQAIDQLIRSGLVTREITLPYLEMERV